MGATVTAISTSPQKEADAKSMGASSFLMSTDTEAMSKAANSFDLILDTVSAGHEVMPYIGALKTNGILPSRYPPIPISEPAIFSYYSVLRLPILKYVLARVCQCVCRAEYVRERASI